MLAAVSLQISSWPCKLDKAISPKIRLQCRLGGQRWVCCSAPCPPPPAVAVSRPPALLAIHEHPVAGAPGKLFSLGTWAPSRPLTFCPASPLPTQGLGPRSQCSPGEDSCPWTFSGVASGPGLDSTIELTGQKGGSVLFVCF